uniref:RNA polymerase II elongation factor ELL N-terminal domain-containing protein n=1 Tax=Anguilla anguilla TaxID=7936 RepID=A0A0E9V4Z1_ANGAN
MAALKEEQCYGLSCGRVSNGSNVSVFHVKLTDSALRAFEAYQTSKVRDKFDSADPVNFATRLKEILLLLR